MYVDAKLTFSAGQLKKLKTAINQSKPVTVKLSHSQLIGSNHPVQLTQTQINKINKVIQQGKGAQITFSAAQLKSMQKNGGIFPFLAAIPGLIAAAAPAIAKTAALGALGGAASYGASKAIQAATRGKGLYLKPYKGSGSKKKVQNSRH